MDSWGTGPPLALLHGGFVAADLADFLCTCGPTAAPPQVRCGCSGFRDPLEDSDWERGELTLTRHIATRSSSSAGAKGGADQRKRVGRGGLEPPACGL